MSLLAPSRMSRTYAQCALIADDLPAFRDRYRTPGAGCPSANSTAVREPAHDEPSRIYERVSRDTARVQIRYEETRHGRLLDEIPVRTTAEPLGEQFDEQPYLRRQMPVARI